MSGRRRRSRRKAEALRNKVEATQGPDPANAKSDKVPASHVSVSNKRKRMLAKRRHVVKKRKIGKSIFYRSKTWIPLPEVDEDSERELDPEWLQKSMARDIDEFIDVNEDEKRMMKLWNLHILKHNIRGDVQIPWACEQFVYDFGREIIDKRLYRNFILHLTNLFDFRLLSRVAVFRTVEKLQTQMCRVVLTKVDAENPLISNLDSPLADSDSAAVEDNNYLVPPLLTLDGATPAFLLLKRE